ncbi:hypothetical protein B0T14DRAFT_11982 [Immersiella caudata]|uniref:Uncharacterized protein n=1 Tax=Immersiella caudata TaxID=314043 RepID=A0AA40CBZ2_9PEZI|nr:hypothetical protein B0T14DRAFT_11982 [Immersiella caudata]
MEPVIQSRNPMATNLLANSRLELPWRSSCRVEDRDVTQQDDLRTVTSTHVPPNSTDSSCLVSERKKRLGSIAPLRMPLFDLQRPRNARRTHRWMWSKSRGPNMREAPLITGPPSVAPLAQLRRCEGGMSVLGGAGTQCGTAAHFV